MKGRKRSKLPRKDIPVMHENGWSIRSLSLESGLTETRIKEIINKYKNK